MYGLFQETNIVVGMRLKNNGNVMYYIYNL